MSAREVAKKTTARKKAVEKPVVEKPVAKKPAKNEPTTITCGDCGSKWPATFVECPNCGYEL